MRVKLFEFFFEIAITLDFYAKGNMIYNMLGMISVWIYTYDFGPCSLSHKAV